MVYKIKRSAFYFSTWVLVFFVMVNVSISHNAAWASFVVKWTENHNNLNCRKLVDVFLSELRSIASDESIELELTNQTSLSTATLLNLKCLKDTIEVQTKNTNYSFHYLEKAEGFDALDWLKFQKQELQPPVQLSDLTPTPDLQPKLSVDKENQKEGHKLHHTPWFWAGVGTGIAGIVLGILFATNDRQGGAQVEIR